MAIVKSPDFGFDMDCVVCGDVGFLNYDWDDFYGALAEAKRLGWWNRKNKTTGEWEQVCPACLEVILEKKKEKEKTSV